MVLRKVEQPLDESEYISNGSLRSRRTLTFPVDLERPAFLLLQQFRQSV